MKSLSEFRLVFLSLSQALRRKRTEALKKQEEKKAEWRANGHGSYEEIPEEKEFFNVTRKSDNCVIQVSKTA